MKHVIVIGAGQAGSSCVVKLRNLGFPLLQTLLKLTLSLQMFFLSHK